jgi:hypothetical protein
MHGNYSISGSYLSFPTMPFPTVPIRYNPERLAPVDWYIDRVTTSNNQHPPTDYFELHNLRMDPQNAQTRMADLVFRSDMYNALVANVGNLKPFDQNVLNCLTSAWQDPNATTLDIVFGDLSGAQIAVYLQK